jgi:hypothetical protein
MIQTIQIRKPETTTITKITSDGFFTVSCLQFEKLVLDILYGIEDGHVAAVDLTAGDLGPPMDTGGAIFGAGLAESESESHAVA